jgi:prepilin-type N-terminal cleavage/methylation domain-containing protein
VLLLRVEVTALLNKKGLTLVEVMIALVVLLIVSLALMQTALVSIDANMANILRDEAVSIAEMRMNEARNTPFNSLVGTLNTTVLRNFRNVANFQYNVTRTVTDLNTDNKQVNITVTWEWKENTVANGNPLTHNITSIVKRP